MRVAIPIIFSLVHVARAALVKHTLTLTNGFAAPDGYNRPVYLVNGQTPGPEIVATQGDQVEITIVNHINVSTTVHFHGISQHGSVWADGVPGITQRLIDPGVTFVANFTVYDHGAYWYHAHSRAIYGDGVRGSLRVLPADLTEAPFSEISSNKKDIEQMKAAHLNSKLASFADWTHFTSEYSITQWNLTGVEPTCVDSVLLNGKGRVICPVPETFAPYTNGNPAVPAVTAKGCAYPNNTAIQPFPGEHPELLDPIIFETCKNTSSAIDVIGVNSADGWASVSIVSMAATWDYKFSIDDHRMWVYAADGQFHYPQEVDVVLLAPGERYQVMVKLRSDETEDFAIRIAAQITPQYISGYGVFSYLEKLNTGKVIPAAKNPSVGYGGDTLSGKTDLVPLTLRAFPDTIVPPKHSNFTLTLELYRRAAMQWDLNTDPFSPFLELEEPLLMAPQQAKSLSSDLVPTYAVGTTVDVIIMSNTGNPQHPIHKHGVKAWIIGAGDGEFTWANVTEAMKAVPKSFNLVNPSFRDGFHTALSVLSPSWLVIRYHVIEPSVTFFHCHINTHNVGGMAVALLEGMPPAMVGMPEYYTTWDAQAKLAQAPPAKGRRSIS